jgi:dihydropteroate synthase
MSDFLHTLKKPVIMGILNVTPDSFSDGGHFFSQQDALRQAMRMIADGADIIDVGGESTRPGAQPVSVAEELERVVPIIELIRNETDTPVSVDTSKAEVMKAAVAAGASMINDVAALAEEGALSMAAELQVPVCLMHMQGKPRTMQKAPQYNDGVVSEVKRFLAERVGMAVDAGISGSSLIIDPGFGFGKTLQHNYELLNRLSELQSLGLPILVGISRKSMIGNLLNAGMEERLPGSLAAAVLAMERGASIFRVHDVAETRQALTVVSACQHEGKSAEMQPG